MRKRHIIEVKLMGLNELTVEHLKNEIEALILEKYDPTWCLEISSRESKDPNRYV